MHLGAEIVDDALFRLIAEGNVFEIHAAPDICQLYRMLCGLDFFVLFQEFKHTLRGCRHRLHLVQHLCDLLHGLGEVLHVLDECLDITDGDGTTNGEQSAGQCHSGIAQVPTNIMIGCISPDRNWDFHAE